MGLLDEAIREHLELKRRRGGDPSAIAREEREALAPGLADEPADEAAHAADETPTDIETSALDAALATSVPASAQDRPEDRVAEMAAGGQETAELDMQAVMEDDPDAADPGAPEPPLVDGPALAGHGDEPSEDDLLEWELPGDRERDPPPEPIPGQERLSFE
ncbi:MAG TPA: hypothetical protein VK721_04995 [Solirubrobacteraceae bacterium]|jgi:hypothetical protein|nr:hypothetical protein [Solirubrobacteraceae bacterium]